MNKNKIMKSMPTVLFISGIAGIFVSEVMVARDTLKAQRVLTGEVKIKMIDDGSPEPYADNAPIAILCNTKPEYYKERIKATWKCYIPTAISTTLTIAALIASNRLTAKQVAMLSSAVAGAGSLVNRYRDKIREHVSPEVLKEIDKEIAAEEITKAKPPVISTSGLISSEHFDPSVDGEYLFFDPFTKIKFRASKLGVLAAKYYLNRNFALGGCVGLEMFYNFLGMDLPEEYRACEWDCEYICDSGYYWIDIDLTKSDEPDPETGELYYILNYGIDPGECEESFYPMGNPVDTSGSHVEREDK